MQLVTSQCGGSPPGWPRWGSRRSRSLSGLAVRDWGGQKADVLDHPEDFHRADRDPGAGRVFSSRRGLLRRVADELGDLQRTRAQLRATQADMVAVLDELGLSRLAGIPALTAVGAAANSLAQTVTRAATTPIIAGQARRAVPVREHLGRFRWPGAHLPPRPGLRLTVWRAVWPMLQYNPVMAAKYQAMTRAADAAQPAQDHSSPQRRRPRPAPGAPRPGWRAPPPCSAGSTAWSSTTPAGIPPPPPAPAAATTPRKTRRRLPDQHFMPPPGQAAPRPSSPMRGRASPHFRRGPTPPHPGQLSPGRPDLLTSSVRTL